MMRKWRARREWRRSVNNAIRLGKLGQFHQERVHLHQIQKQTDLSSDDLLTPVRP